MTKFGCPAKFIAMIRQFQMVGLHGSKMMASFLIRSLCKWSKARLCTTFNAVQHNVSAMLTDAFQDDDTGIAIRYRSLRREAFQPKKVES